MIMLKLYAYTPDFYRDLGHFISRATHRITLSYHAFCQGSVSEALSAQLLHQASRGVNVTVIVDAFGQFTETFPHFLPNFKLLTHLARHNVNVVLHKPIPNPRRLHAKIILVDDHFLGIGGSNIADHYAKWQDLNLIINHAFPMTLHQIVTSSSPGIYPLSPSLKLSLSHNQNRSHLDLLESLINSARHHLYLCTWYMHPPQPIMSALKQARNRGVDITILYSHQNRVPITQIVNHSCIKKLRHLKINLYRYHTSFFHTKCYFNDQGHILLGSPNLDWYSSYLFTETSLFLIDSTLKNQLHKQVIDWQKSSLPLF